MNNYNKINNTNNDQFGVFGVHPSVHLSLREGYLYYFCLIIY